MRTKKIASLLLVAVLALGSITVQPVHAATIKSAKQKAQELEAKKKKAKQEQASLSEKLNAIIKDMQETQAKVEAKERDFDSGR